MDPEAQRRLANLQGIIKWSMRQIGDEPSPNPGTSSFKPMDDETKKWLQEALSAISDTPSETDLLKASLAVLKAHRIPAESGSLSQDEKQALLTAANDTLYFIEDLDHANDLIPLGGVEVISSLVDHPDSECRQAACELIGTACQNNPKTQGAFLPSLSSLFKIARNEEEEGDTRVKAFFAISCSSWHAEVVEAVAEVIKKSGQGEVREMATSTLAGLARSSPRIAVLCKADNALKEVLKKRTKELTHEDTDGQSSPNKVKGAMAPIRRGNLRIDQYGEASYKKTPSETLKRSIQLGLQVSIGALEPKPKRDLLMTDFEVEELVSFPSDGSSDTPAHNYSSFKFKTYSPIAFRFFRDAFGIAPQDFMLALCDKPLVDLSNPGASGSLFYLSSNDEFIMKTVQRKEAEFLQKLLPGYYLNLTQNRYTLLPKFFGLYKYQCGGTNIRIVAMNNLLPRNYVYHEKFDLKGSTYKRKASQQEREKKSPTFKDLDFAQMHPEGFTLSPEHYDAVSDSLSRDVKVLESFSIMDYSLLFAVHYLDKDVEPSVVLTQSLDVTAVPETEDFEEARRRRATFSILSKDKKPIVRKRATEEAVDSGPLESSGLVYEGVPAHAADGRRVLLFVGIIDILQSYRLKKKLEHGFKSIYADGNTISVCHPHDYGQRFLNFMTTQVFKKGKVKGKAKKLSIRGNKKSTVAVTERVPLRRESDRHDSVPPSYTEVLEKDKNSKRHTLESTSDRLLSDTDPSSPSRGESSGQTTGEQGEGKHTSSPSPNSDTPDISTAPVSVQQMQFSLEPSGQPSQVSKEHMQPSEGDTLPSEGDTLPSEERSQPSEEHTQPSEEQMQTSEEKTQPSEEQTQISEEHTQPSEEQTQISEEHTQPSEERMQPSEEQTQPSEEQTQPSDTLSKRSSKDGDLLDASI